MIEPEDSTRAAPRWVTTYPTWPVPNLHWSTLYLTATGELVHEKPQSNENHGMRSYVYPLGTELVGNNEQFALNPHPLRTLSYRTPPMTSDTVLLGSPQLTIFVSTDQTDTDFLFTLKDIDPSGNTLFLQRSVLRASLRSIDKELSTPDEIVPVLHQDGEAGARRRFTRSNSHFRQPVTWCARGIGLNCLFSLLARYLIPFGDFCLHRQCR